MSATTSSNAGDPVVGLAAAAARQRFRRRERADSLLRDASLDHGLTFRITGGDTSWDPPAPSDSALTAPQSTRRRIRRGLRASCTVRWRRNRLPASGAMLRHDSPPCILRKAHRPLERIGGETTRNDGGGWVSGPPRRHPEVPERSEGLEGCCSAVQLLCCPSFEARPTSSGKRPGSGPGQALRMTS